MRFEWDAEKHVREVEQALFVGMGDAGRVVMAAAKKKVSDDVLKVRSGTLKRSIDYEVEKSGGDFTTRIGTNVWYGRLHEFGGTFTVPAHERTVKGSDEKQQVRAHKMVIPARPWLTPAFNENIGEAQQAVADAVQEFTGI